MARAKSQGNGCLSEVMADLARAQEKLDQAQGDLVRARANLALAQNEASMLQTHAVLVQSHAAFDASQKESAERFARIEAAMAEIIRMLDAPPTPSAPSSISNQRFRLI
jgi:hypothetical protein